MALCFPCHQRKEGYAAWLSILTKTESCFSLLKQKRASDHYSSPKYLCISKIKTHVLLSSAEWSSVPAKQLCEELEGFRILQH